MPTRQTMPALGGFADEISRVQVFPIDHTAPPSVENCCQHRSIASGKDPLPIGAMAQNLKEAHDLVADFWGHEPQYHVL